MSVARIDMAGERLFAPLMKNMFGGGNAAGQATPPRPRVIRMPTSSDPSVLAAGARARANTLNRSGRLSTILSENTRSLANGARGKLGA